MKKFALILWIIGLICIIGGIAIYIAERLKNPNFEFELPFLGGILLDEIFLSIYLFKSKKTGNKETEKDTSDKRKEYLNKLYGFDDEDD